MEDNGSRLQRQAQGREKLEDRYGKIGIPALAAALDASRPQIDHQKQMVADAVTRLQQMAQS
jgi:hypothetical protein